MSITHLIHAKLDCGNRIHISHLYHYVSAYCISPEETQTLCDMLEVAINEAKTTKQIQIVDRDGEFCFHVTPAGYIILMIPWKTFIVD